DTGAVTVAPLELQRVTPNVLDLQRVYAPIDAGGVEQRPAGHLLDTPRARTVEAQQQRFVLGDVPVRPADAQPELVVRGGDVDRSIGVLVHGHSSAQCAYGAQGVPRPPDW